MTSTRSLKSELDGRTLRFDGVSEIPPDRLVEFLFLGVPPKKIRVAGGDDAIAIFNEQVPEEDQILSVHPEPIAINLDWQVPEPYRSLDISKHIETAFHNRLDLVYTRSEERQAILRIEAELKEVHERGMVEFMRTVIYILETLKKNNVVWGVGRGSSCASYLLFIIGLHVVDCIKFDVPMAEFFHE